MKKVYIFLSLFVIVALIAFGTWSIFQHLAKTETNVSITGLHVSGNKILNANNEIVIPRGVNRSGTEYQCVNKAGIFDGPSDAASVEKMALWHINVVRLPLNVICWLGINGVPEAYSGTNYRQALIDYVQLLNEHNMMVILDLHWTAPGKGYALSQPHVPDLDHSIDFWRSVATTFKDNTSVIFDLYNEPDSGNWLCWRDGSGIPKGTPCEKYNFAVTGMQGMLDAVRGTGASNLVMLSGLGYASYLPGMLHYLPNDPLHNLVVSFHAYPSTGCASIHCMLRDVAPVIASMPVIFGELGEMDCSHSYVDPVMDWLDNLQTGYVAWAWNVHGCSFPSLLTSYDGTPSEFGMGFKNHIARFATRTL